MFKDVQGIYFAYRPKRVFAMGRTQRLSVKVEKARSRWRDNNLVVFREFFADRKNIRTFRALTKFPVTWYQMVTHLGFSVSVKKTHRNPSRCFFRPCLRLCLGKVWGQWCWRLVFEETSGVTFPNFEKKDDFTPLIFKKDHGTCCWGPVTVEKIESFHETCAVVVTVTGARHQAASHTTSLGSGFLDPYLENHPT